jgi:hypothetical protein
MEDRNRGQQSRLPPNRDLPDEERRSAQNHQSLFDGLATDWQLKKLHRNLSEITASDEGA